MVGGCFKQLGRLVGCVLFQGTVPYLSLIEILIENKSCTITVKNPFNLVVYFGSKLLLQVEIPKAKRVLGHKSLYSQDFIILGGMGLFVLSVSF